MQRKKICSLTPTSLKQSLTEHSRSHVVEVISWSWSRQKLSRVLLGQELKEQAKGMKGSSFSTGHEPLERTKQLFTLNAKATPPKRRPEICRKQRRWKKPNESDEWASARYNNVLVVGR